MYVLSTLERARSLRRLLEAFGVPREALQRVHVCGADGILFGTDSDHQRPREVSPDLSVSSSSNGKPRDGDKALASAFPLGQTASTQAPSRALGDATATDPDGPATDAVSPEADPLPGTLAGALALWQHHVRMGFRGVPHFIDDDIRSLEAAAADPRQAARLSATDTCSWGATSGRF